MVVFRFCIFFLSFFFYTIVIFPADSLFEDLSTKNQAKGIPNEIELTLRQSLTDGSVVTSKKKIRSSELGIVIVDMWDGHRDPPTKAMLESLIPRLNETLLAARKLGVTIFYAISNVPSKSISKANENYAPILDALADPSIPDLPPFPGNGFFWPQRKIAPMENQISQMPPGVKAPSSKQILIMHPDIQIRPSFNDLVVDAYRPGNAKRKEQGWNAAALTEIYKTAKKRGITHLLYAGVATNQCLMNTGFSVVNMKRLGFEVLLMRDLTNSGSSNGIDPLTGQPDARIYPNLTGRTVDAWFEKNIGSSMMSLDLTRWLDTPFSRYSVLILSEPSLLAYWSMSGNAGYQSVQDRVKTQDAWGDHLEWIQEGIIPPDSAALFKGNNAILISPFFRADTPPESPLENLSADSLTVEAWVIISGGQGKPRWIITHDDGTDTGIDFLLGLNAENHFEWITNGIQNRAIHPYIVTPEDIRSGRIFHIAGVQDLKTRKSVLYVNGEAASAPIRKTGSEIKTKSSLQIGSRGTCNIDDGEKGEGKSGKILSKGFEFFEGIIDEVAIYKTALDAGGIQKHYSTGTSSNSQD